MVKIKGKDKGKDRGKDRGNVRGKVRIKNDTHKNHRDLEALKRRNDPQASRDTMTIIDDNRLC